MIVAGLHCLKRTDTEDTIRPPLVVRPKGTLQPGDRLARAGIHGPIKDHVIDAGRQLVALHGVPVLAVVDVLDLGMVMLFTERVAKFLLLR